MGLKAGDKKGMMERLLQQGVTSLVGVDTSGGTDGSKGRRGDGSQHLEELQRRAAQMGLTQGGGSGNGSLRGGSLGGGGGGLSVTGSANRQGLAPKPLSLAAALNKQPPPSSTSSHSSSHGNLAQGQGLARPMQNAGTGRPVAAPPVVRPLSGDTTHPIDQLNKTHLHTCLPYTLWIPSSLAHITLIEHVLSNQTTKSALANF